MFLVPKNESSLFRQNSGNGILRRTDSYTNEKSMGAVMAPKFSSPKSVGRLKSEVSADLSVSSHHGSCVSNKKHISFVSWEMTVLLQSIYNVASGTWEFECSSKDAFVTSMCFCQRLLSSALTFCSIRIADWPHLMSPEEKNEQASERAKSSETRSKSLCIGLWGPYTMLYGLNVNFFTTSALGESQVFGVYILVKKRFWCKFLLTE